MCKKNNNDNDFETARNDLCDRDTNRTFEKIEMGCDEDNEKLKLRLLNELYRETLLSTNGELETEKIIDIMDKIEEIDPPEPVDVENALEKFYIRYKPVFRKENSLLHEHSWRIRKRNRKPVVGLAMLTLLLIITGSVLVGAFGFDVFNMRLDFSEGMMRIIFNKSPQNDIELDAPGENAIEVEPITNIHSSIEEALKVIPFNPLLPKFIPENIRTQEIQTEVINNNRASMRITYVDEDGENCMNIFIRYSQSSTINVSDRLSEDYKIISNLPVLDGEAIIASDGYNIVSFISYHDMFYNISTSNSISLSDIIKIIESLSLNTY